MTGLVPTNPRLIDIDEETLDLRHLGLSPRESLLMPAFSLPNAPPRLPAGLYRVGNAPLPPPT